MPASPLIAGASSTVAGAGAAPSAGNPGGALLLRASAAQGPEAGARHAVAPLPGRPRRVGLPAVVTSLDPSSPFPGTSGNEPSSPSVAPSSLGTATRLAAWATMDTATRAERERARRAVIRAVEAALGPAQAAMHSSSAARSLMARAFSPLGPAKLVESVGHLLVRLSPAVCGEYGHVLRCAAVMAQSDPSCARYFVDLVLRRWPRMDSSRAVLLLKFVVAAPAAWKPHRGLEVKPRTIVDGAPRPPRPTSRSDDVMKGLLARGHLSAVEPHDPSAPPTSRARAFLEASSNSRGSGSVAASGANDTCTPSSGPGGTTSGSERPNDAGDAGVFSAARLRHMASRDELRAALVRRVCASLRSPHGQLATTAAGLCHPFPAGTAAPSPLVSCLITCRPSALAVIAALSTPDVTKHWNATVTKNAKVVSRGLAALALRSGLAARDDIASSVRAAASLPAIGARRTHQ